jgi:prevent-host-death family protein
VNRQVTATELKATLLAALDDVAGGDEIEITKHGRTVARLVPARGSASLRGLLTGIAVTAADDDELFSTGEGWESE